MSYIGNQPPDIGAYDVESFNGGGTSFTLKRAATVSSVLLFIDGVRQTPTDAYTVSGVTLTTTATTPSGTDNVTVMFMGDVVDIGAPSNDTVSTVKIEDDAVTAAKLANSINTEITANTAKTGITSGQASAITANTAKVTNATHTGDVTGATALTIATDAVDIAMLSATGTASATTFLRGDNAWATVAAADNTPAFLARMSTTQSIPNASWTKLAIDDEKVDTDGAYDNSTNYRFTVPSGEAGMYVLFGSVGYGNIGANKYSTLVMYVNGTFESSDPWRSRTSEKYTWPTNTAGWRIPNGSCTMELIVGDYIELWTAHDHGSAHDASQNYTYFGGFKLAGV